MTADRDTVKRQARQVFWKSLRAPFVMAWVILIKRAIIWDSEPTMFQERDSRAQPVGEPFPVLRGRLPEKYREWETPDERIPGGIYEPFMLKLWRLLGPYWCAYWWLGVRNRANGFELRYAKSATRHWPKTEGLHTQGEGENAIWLERKLYLGGRFERLRGYRVYSHDNGQTFYATPVWTYKRA